MDLKELIELKENTKNVDDMILDHLEGWLEEQGFQKNIRSHTNAYLKPLNDDATLSVQLCDFTGDINLSWAILNINSDEVAQGFMDLSNFKEVVLNACNSKPVTKKMVFKVTFQAWDQDQLSILEDVRQSIEGYIQEALEDEAFWDVEITS